MTRFRSLESFWRDYFRYELSRTHLDCGRFAEMIRGALDGRMDNRAKDLFEIAIISLLSAGFAGLVIWVSRFLLWPG